LVVWEKVCARRVRKELLWWDGEEGEEQVGCGREDAKVEEGRVCLRACAII
jgi:hypothetical protein